MKAIEMSPSSNQKYGLQRVCKNWNVCRSTIYARRKLKQSGRQRLKRGPKPQISDDIVLMEIRRDIHESPFSGEGHKKVHARLRKRKGVVVGRERIRRLMRENKLLSPHRVTRVKKNLHDGQIITHAPNDMWATDATKIKTIQDGIVFILVY